MGQRGPLPKTTARKRLEGNPGHRPLPDDEPEPSLCEVVPPPAEWLKENQVACDAWWLIARELHAAKMLASLDLYVLELFVVSYAQWRKMLEGIQSEGYVYRTYDEDDNLKFAAQTPEATLASKFASECNRWAKVLGLGPAYRVGLRVGDTGDKGRPSDPIAAMLAGGTGDVNPPPKRAKKTVKRKVKKATKKRVAKKAVKKTAKKRSARPTAKK